jgi:hypothetical protein
MRFKLSLTHLAGVVFTGVLLAASCPAETAPRPAGPGPANVTIRQTDGRWQLYVNGQPFYIRGAGLEFGDPATLAAAGANSFRTWRTENGRESGRQVLDRALKNGLFVTMGLDVGLERKGFDYNDTNAVAQQLARIRAQVMQYKDHPALLMWDIGNELNLDAKNPRVWDAVGQISRMIHQVDPHHPTTTSLAGISKELVAEIKERAPDLDLICVQSYADIVNLPRELQHSGWTGPYAVTEWGATGHWECGKTAWGAPIEDNSSVKAALYQKRYQIAIAADHKQCLGSYVFLWGQKQERTPTWYGMFLASGEATEAVDVMQHLWTGTWPAHRSPEVKGLWLDDKTASQNVRLISGKHYPARVQALSPSGNETLTCRWEIRPESGATSIGGDFEAAPKVIPGLVSPGRPGEAEITAPKTAGAYRLFVYVENGHNRAGYANIPFYVDAQGDAVAARH